MDKYDEHDEHGLLMPGEVADLLRVSLGTLRGWSNSGLLHPVILPSGHRRYRRDEIESILDESGTR